VTRAPLFRPQAEAEALEAHRWYEASRAGLGAEVDAAVARIVEPPLAFPRVRGNTRRAVGGVIMSRRCYTLSKPKFLSILTQVLSRTH